MSLLKRIGLALTEESFSGFLAYKREHNKRHWTFSAVLNYNQRYGIQFLKQFELDALVGLPHLVCDDETVPPFSHYISFHSAPQPHASCRILTDDEKVGELAAEHLLELGLKRFYYISPFDFPESRKRMTGFRRILRVRGYDCQYLKAPRGSGDVDNGVSYLTVRPAAYKTVIDSMTFPAGVLAFNDALAYALSSACNTSGVNLPNDLCLLGTQTYPA